MAAATQGYLSLTGFDQLDNADQKRRLEYWFGQAIQKPMPAFLHGLFQWIVAMMLDKRGWMPGTEIRLKLSDRAQPTPDVIADIYSLEEPYPTKPFALCVEIASPRDELNSLFQKAAHYLEWGIGCV